jgi:hypothetical protein
VSPARSPGRRRRENVVPTDEPGVRLRRHRRTPQASRSGGDRRRARERLKATCMPHTHRGPRGSRTRCPASVTDRRSRPSATTPPPTAVPRPRYARYSQALAAASATTSASGIPVHDGRFGHLHTTPRWSRLGAEASPTRSGCDPFAPDTSARSARKDATSVSAFCDHSNRATCS